MNLVEVVILLGAQCLSPMEQGPGLTVVGKVPCAVLIRQDPQTAAIEIVPRSAATDPAVIAMLVKPAATPVIKADRQVARVGDDITGSITPAPPRIVPTSAEVQPELATPKPKPTVKKTRVAKAAVKKRVAVTRRSDACGSYKAVWYTNKDGHRKYRCVKTG